MLLVLWLYMAFSYGYVLSQVMDAVDVPEHEKAIGLLLSPIVFLILLFNHIKQS